MLRIDKVIKPWKESAALNDHINLYKYFRVAQQGRNGSCGDSNRLAPRMKADLASQCFS